MVWWTRCPVMTLAPSVHRFWRRSPTQRQSWCLSSWASAERVHFGERKIGQIGFTILQVCTIPSILPLGSITVLTLLLNINPLPIDQYRVCQFVATLAAEQVSHSTVKGYLSALRHLQIYRLGYDPNICDTPEYGAWSVYPVMGGEWRRTPAVD